ncbi:MAG: hypothetical protein WC548_02325 [Candidatus Pacearchaeota archaeon]
MPYELKDVLNMLRIYHLVESESEKFLSFSSFAMKNKIFKLKSARSTLEAIKEYKKLPTELKMELKKDPATNASKIDEIEKLCKETLGN